MRPFKIRFVFWGAGLIFCACSQDPGGNPTTSSSSSSGSGGAGGAHCLSVYIPYPDCNVCLQQECCAEMAACGAEDYCIECTVRGGTAHELPCSVPWGSPALNNLGICLDKKCNCICSGHASECDGGSGGSGGASSVSSTTSSSSSSSGGGSGG